VTTPTSRRRDVRASTAAAPADDEERGARRSPALAKEREDGCRLLLLRYASGGQPPRESTPRLRCLPLARVSPRGGFSLATPRGSHPRDLLPPSPIRRRGSGVSLVPTPPPRSLPPSLPSSSRSTVLSHALPPSLSVSVSLPLSLSPSLSLALARSLSLSLSFSLGTRASAPGSPSPRRYPTTGVSSNQPPLGPLAPCRAHPPARVTSQQRSPRPRPRAETDRESSAFRQSAIRLAATPRHAARSACVSAPRFKKPASERRSPTSRAPRAVNHRRGATPRGSRRACDPSGFRLFNRIPLRHGDRQYLPTSQTRKRKETEDRVTNHVVTSRDPRETASGRTRSGRPARAADDTRYAYAYGTRASARPLIGDT